MNELHVFIIVFKLTKVRDRKHLQGIIVVECIPIMSAKADVMVNISVEPVMPDNKHNIKFI